MRIFAVYPRFVRVFGTVRSPENQPIKGETGAGMTYAEASLISRTPNLDWSEDEKSEARAAMMAAAKRHHEALEKEYEALVSFAKFGLPAAILVVVVVVVVVVVAASCAGGL